MKRKEKGFTLIEGIIVLCVIAVISVLSMVVITKNSPEIYKLRSKQAYLLIKNALGQVVSNPQYYTPEGNLTDLTQTETDDVMYLGTNKFRNLMLKELEIEESARLTCEFFNGEGAETDNICYQAENGVIFAIPNTDFVSENLIRHRNAQGSVANYLPITIYPNSSVVSTQKSDYMTTEAIFIGVRADGVISIVNSVDCEDDIYKDSAQCNAADYIATLSVDFK